MNTTHIEITPDYLASQGLSETFPQRFWEKVITSSDTSDCWIWTGGKDGCGYGRIIMGVKNRKTIPAHVASWILHFGPVPKTLCVLHHCDVRFCVKPDHLWIGTRTDNARDRDSKHRIRTGEDSPSSKLTQNQVNNIRFLYWDRRITQSDLSVRFDISQSEISRILNHKRWNDYLET